MKKLGKVLGIIVALIVLAAVGIFGYSKYEDYQREKEKKEKEEDKIAALSKINYTIPEGFDLPSPGDRGYGYIDYNYEENDMLAQIVLEVWNQEKYPAYDSVEERISSIMDGVEGRGEAIIRGPEDVDLNGLKGKMIVTGDQKVSEEWDVHLLSQSNYYVFEKDGYLYIFKYNIIDERMGDRDDTQTNKCVTSLEVFVNSIGDK